jgi:F-type H+-transporting ATPase subunit a
MDLLSQFNLITYIPIALGAWRLDFTNSSFAMIIAATIVGFAVIIRGRGYLISIMNVYTSFINNIIISNAGHDALFAAPFVSSIFLFIAISNLLGLIPYVFTTTSHLIVNITISTLVLVYIIFNGLRNNGLQFLRIFCPSGIPLLVRPLIIVIEIFSFMARAASLALRLTANMFVGHLIMKILLYLSVQFGYVGLIVWPIYVAILFFELGIALLHAYIFTFLTCMYLKDTIESHH